MPVGDTEIINAESYDLCDRGATEPSGAGATESNQLTATGREHTSITGAIEKKRKSELSTQAPQKEMQKPSKQLRGESTSTSSHSSSDVIDIGISNMAGFTTRISLQKSSEWVDIS